MAILCVEQKDEQRAIRLGRVTRVGLTIDDDADVCLRLGHKEQCVIRQVEGAWLIEDSFSGNRTYLNRKPVPDAGARLRSGDEIWIWSVRARFYEEKDAPPGLTVEEARVVEFAISR
jgi:hypothetical protein